MRQSTIDRILERVTWNLPFIRGSWFFVDPTSGSATANGRTPSTAVASIATAYAKCTSGRGDGIAVISAGTTTAGCTSYLSESLDWTKWGITVVGIAAPTRMAQRARISNLSTATALAYLIDVQGGNTAFHNLHIANFGAGAAAVGGVKVTGDRNYFKNCHIIGGGGHTATNNDYDVTLSTDETTFEDCTFGSDTFDRGDKTNANVIFAGGGLSARDEFIRCNFISYHSTGTTAGAVKFGGSGDAICRNIRFRDCIFEVYDEAAAAAEAECFIGTMPNNGVVILKGDNTRLGYTDWAAAANARVYTEGIDAAADGAGGILIASNPS